MKPIKELSNKHFKIAVWQNPTGTTWLTLSRSFKNKKTGQWVKESINLFPEQLQELAELCAQTEESINQIKMGNSTMTNIPF